ncbi:MAG: transcription antitermination factor NusB [Clostridia bacterium]|nr:transcription antitermination factor NusB [Clostridia bacterium]
MKRKEARAEAMKLVFESAFRDDETSMEIYDRALELRGIEEDGYIRDVFFGVRKNLEFIDGKITEYSNGWSVRRMSRVALASMRIAVYEMYFRDDVPDTVAVNEALENIKVYDDEGTVRKFVNGILNSVLREKEPAAKDGDK